MRYLLESGGSAYPSQIKEATGLSQARISNTLAALEAKGFIQRSADGKDRRHVVVTLTDAGRQNVAERMAAIDSYMGSLLQELGEQDSQELIRIVGRLASVLQDRVEKAQETMKEGQ